MCTVYQHSVTPKHGAPNGRLRQHTYLCCVHSTMHASSTSPRRGLNTASVVEWYVHFCTQTLNTVKSRRPFGHDIIKICCVGIHQRCKTSLLHAAVHLFHYIVSYCAVYLIYYTDAPLGQCAVAEFSRTGRPPVAPTCFSPQFGNRFFAEHVQPASGLDGFFNSIRRLKPRDLAYALWGMC